ncbi:DASS family sodium-coupled anion symporter [Bacillus sp. H-16]|uniref:SLC13 family permease n=1 Tax=Alteribacter salitolerans TaxID=2912333 RepID=UPI0019623E90|nr:DASS family sodium-coupled anion symporter [Alteribacter salitolerans]MBM7094766.1 DASS family sodium-coupled anion symporter [Alteribacter salitolerans]
MSTLTKTWNQMWKWHHQAIELLTFNPGGRTGSGGTGGGSTAEQPDTGTDPEKEPRSYDRRQLIGLVLGPLLFIATLLFFSPEGLSWEARAVLASTLWIATWWITEAIPIPATSIMPIILFPLTGSLESGTVVSAYGDNTVFLFMGGFVLALALEKWGVHKRIAIAIISVIGTSTPKIVLGFMVATGFLSMWISNTATAMMMVPIGTAIILQVSKSLKENKKGDTEVERVNFSRALLLGIAYSASIGGLGTLIGTPPNTIFAGVVNQLYGIDISFAIWMLFGVPLSILLLGLVWFYLVKIQFKMKITQIPGGHEVIQSEKRALGKVNPEEKIVFAVFVVTAFFWISRTFIFDGVEAFEINDTTIAIAAAVSLFLIPSIRMPGRIMDWDTAKKLPWGILLLFGGGLAIAAGFTETGLAEYIGNQLTVLAAVNFFVILLAVTALVIFLTEITSNTATATMMFPIMASLAFAIDVHPYALMVAAALAASCAFMLPVATPPNAVVFASTDLRIGDMAKAGFWINLFSIFLIAVFVYFYLPLAWGIDLQSYPF